MVDTLTSRIAGLIGVTRVARVTGLDRTGVEVAAAIRPGGHVLQVCNGKGESPEGAALGAVLEAAELFFSEQFSSQDLVYASRKDLLGRRPAAEVWPATALGSAGALVAPELWSDEVVCAWSRGRGLLSGAEILVPAQAVRCPPPGGPALGPICVAWTTNGMGAHPDPDAALLHALLEAAERDQLARTLPDGWTEEEVTSRRLSGAALRARAPGAWGWVEKLSERGFRVALFDLSPDADVPGALGLPVAGALLVDAEGGPIPLTAGYACRMDRDAALTSALLEAAQSRLTDIHGARDDVASTQDPGLELLRGFLLSTSGAREVSKMPKNLSADSPSDAVRQVMRRLQRAGVPDVAAVPLAPEGAPLHVVKAVIPGFRVSELLL